MIPDPKHLVEEVANMFAEMAGCAAQVSFPCANSVKYGWDCKCQTSASAAIRVVLKAAVKELKILREDFGGNPEDWKIGVADSEDAICALIPEGNE